MAATLQFRLTGGAANSDPDLSLGGVSSSTQVSATALNNIFDDVSAAEALSGDTEYRAIDVYNAGDATASGVEICMSTITSSTDSDLAFGLEATPTGSTTSIANESTAPDLTAGTAFASFTSASKLTLPDIAAAAYVRLWIRRTIGVGATNTANDSGTIEVTYA